MTKILFPSKTAAVLLGNKILFILKIWLSSYWEKWISSRTNSFLSVHYPKSRFGINPGLKDVNKIEYWYAYPINLANKQNSLYITL